MGNGKQTPPPDTDAMPPVGETWRDRLLGHGAKPGGSLERMLDKDNARRTAEAQLHWDNYKRTAAILAAGYDPDSKDADGNLLPMTPQVRAKYEAQYNVSKANYEKAAGVNKEHRGALQQLGLMMDHLIHGGGQKPQSDGQGGGPQAGSLPTPPPLTGVPGGAGGPTQVEESTPPPAQGAGASLTPPPNDNGLADAQIPFKMADVGSQKAFDDYKRRERFLYDLMIEKEEAKAKAKGANPTGRAYAMQPISLSRAKQLNQDSGMTFAALDPSLADEDGNLTLDNYANDMMLVPLQQNGKVIGYYPSSQKQTHFAFNNQVVAIPQYNQTDAAAAGTPLGAQNVDTTTKTTDPISGQTTVAKKTYGKGSTPAAVTPGAPTTAAPGVPTTTTPGAAAVPTPATKVSGQKPTGPPTATAAPAATASQLNSKEPPLDVEGHILQDWKGASPQVIEMANQLIDGVDIKELRGGAKYMPLAESLARRTGWKRGMFSPRELNMVKEAAGFIDDLDKSPSLKVLDNKNWLNRGQMSQVLVDPEKQGMVGRGLSIISATGMSKDQAEYIDLYNQAAQAVAGMGQLVRAGRMTQAMFNRLRLDLPNPATTRDAADGKRKLALLKKEIAIAISHQGDMDIVESGGRSKKQTPPPGESKAAPGITPGARKYLESKGVKIPQAP
jgi:hypothetical protein